MKYFYTFKCPMGANDCKIGITGHPAVRLSAYQNSYSRRSHTACFDLVYAGTASAINNLEKVIKQRYDWAIASDKGGESEWVADHTVEDIEKIVDDLIFGFKFKVNKIADEFLPLSKDNLEDYLSTIP